MSTSWPKPPNIQGMLVGAAAMGESSTKPSIEERKCCGEVKQNAPIFHIPAEIRLRIFELIPEPPYHPEPPTNLSYLPASATWSLTRVCKSLERIVSGMPSLWCNLRFPKSLSEIGLTDAQYLEIANVTLNRSGSHYLNFSIDLEERALSIDILRLLARHSQQWRNVEFLGDCPSFSLSNVLSPIKGNLCNLESLTISCRPLRHLDVFQIAPRLQRVDVRLHSADEIDLPLSQLRAFTTDQLSSDPIAFLQQCTHLSEFGYVGGNEAQVVGHPYDVVHFPQIRVLNVEHPSVFHRLSTPGLKELKYHFSNDVDTVLKFLTISRCNLTCLGIAWTTEIIDTRPFVTLLQKLPNLQHLKIYNLWNYHHDDQLDVYRALRLGDGMDNLVPNLQELTLDLYDPSIFDPDDIPMGETLFESVMLSRLGRLRKLTLMQRLFTIPPCVESLRNVGIDVVVDWERWMEMD
ncbi:hypothetical protein IW261DRAFT_1596390 [Armillaria novae-zelandiae]|uniref:F-box domain-containing protein n=1 Tax=Armillaria novae-zelandiae TaxID=153914 RepID=A0AA39NXW2_9AGAR|nr:hypothetical protein IW261DRAFT_1596390 [Armillaria novae-zelandiae]